MITGDGMMVCDIQEEKIWRISGRDCALLEDIREELWGWRTHAFSAKDLMALGAALEGLDHLIDNEDPTCAVQIGRVVRPERLDGISVDFALSDDRIVLSQMEYVWTGQGQSCDHGTTFDYVLEDEGGFEAHKIKEWLSMAQQLSFDDSRLETDLAYLAERN